ncbi:hypothetical protein EYF80_064826 [Liparis tanakae]|uniref:Uncharacterized protein n=1 Tax=Liparis tanakae TaxID=230148 RepID=A0A4Z2E8C1_9TELE|nr:hypothetical protein EYF80_064826 [Liparis tanakae]
MTEILFPVNRLLWSLPHRCRCGTRRARSVSVNPWWSTTTATCTPWSSCTTSPRWPPSATCRRG